MPTQISVLDINLQKKKQQILFFFFYKPSSQKYFVISAETQKNQIT